MKRISGYLIVLLVLILGFSEQESLGAEWGWGVYTYTSVYFVNPDNVLDYVSVYAGPDSLVMGELSRHDYVSYSVGTAEALAQLSAGGITPVLKAWAELGPYNANEPGPAPCYASASAVVRELYQYVGTAPREFTLTLNLSGEMSGSDSSILGRITAGSGLDDFEFLGDLGYTEINLSDTGTESGSFSFVVNPNDYFSVRATLETSVGPYSRADSYNSLTMSFDDPEGLIAQSNPVPVPGALYLLASGLLGIAGIRRRIGMRS